MATEAQRLRRKRRREARRNGRGGRPANSAATPRNPVPANGRRRRNRRSRREGTAPVAGVEQIVPYARASVRGAPNTGGAFTLSGEDMLPKVSPDTTEAGVFYEHIFTPESFERLGRVSSAFQRIRWDFLEIDLQSYFPSNTGGGYVAAFVRDAEQNFGEGEVGVRALFSNAGSGVTKWWADVSAKQVGHSDLLYTTSAETMRLSAPGKLVVASDSAPSQTGYLRPLVKWRVTLSEPTVDQLPGVLTAKIPLYAHLGSSDVATTTDFSTFVTAVQFSWFGVDPDKLRGTKWVTTPAYSQTSTSLHVWSYLTFIVVAGEMKLRGYMLKGDATPAPESMVHSGTILMPGMKINRLAPGE